MSGVDDVRRVWTWEGSDDDSKFWDDPNGTHALVPWEVWERCEKALWEPCQWCEGCTKDGHEIMCTDECPNCNGHGWVIVNKKRSIDNIKSSDSGHTTVKEEE